MPECDVTVLDDVTAVIADDHTAKAVYCPNFQIPCPIVTTVLTDVLLFGAAFRIEFTTDIPTTERYRQREIIGGTPGAWSGFLQFLTDTGVSHTTEETFHALDDHRFSNKSASSTWEYQVLLRWNSQTESELWPQCGNAVIRVNYPPKNDPGGGTYEPEVPIFT
jgi:hypothetical protein